MAMRIEYKRLKSPLRVYNRRQTKIENKIQTNKKYTEKQNE